MEERHTVIPRTLCFVFYQNKILFIKYGQHKKLAGFYNGLGGHIEKGEDVIESAKREIFEESGLKVEDVNLRGIIHVSDFFEKNVMLFVVSAHSASDKVIESDEGELLWVSQQDIESLKTFEDITPVLEKILNGPKTRIFSAKSQFDGKDKLLDLKFLN